MNKTTKTFKIGLSDSDKLKMHDDILKEINGGIPRWYDSLEDIPSDVKSGLVVINGYWYYYDNESKNWQIGGEYLAPAIPNNYIIDEQLSDLGIKKKLSGEDNGEFEVYNNLVESCKIIAKKILGL